MGTRPRVFPAFADQHCRVYDSPLALAMGRMSTGIGSGFSGELSREYGWCVKQRIPALWADLHFTSGPDPWGIGCPENSWK
jgi:hypothetical protein